MQTIQLKDTIPIEKKILVPDKELSDYIYSELQYLFDNKPERKRILIILDDKEFKITKRPKNKETFIERNVSRWFDRGVKKITFQTIIKEREMIIGDKLTVKNQKYDEIKN